MDTNEIKKYIKLVENYERSEEANAISCIRIYGGNVADDKWIDILEVDKGREKERYQFSKVNFATYKKFLVPKYPKRSEFFSEEQYRMVCHGITYETATQDISNQIESGIRGTKYILTGGVGKKGYAVKVKKVLAK